MTPQRSKSARDPLQQLGVLEQPERRLSLALAHRRGGRLRGEALPELGVLELLELEEHFAEVLVKELFLDPKLGGGLLDEAGAGAGLVEVEAVEVEALLPGREDVDPEGVVAAVLRKPADAVAPISYVQEDLIGLELRLDLFERSRGQAGSLRRLGICGCGS